MLNLRFSFCFSEAVPHCLQERRNRGPIRCRRVSAEQHSCVSLRSPSSMLPVLELGFRAWGLGFKVQGLGFRVLAYLRSCRDNQGLLRAKVLGVKTEPLKSHPHGYSSDATFRLLLII